MIVQASQSMFRGARLQPVMRGARPRRGLGALVDDQANFVLQNYLAGNGPSASPDTVRQAMISETANTCNTDFHPQVDCPNGVPTATIEAAVATYAAALAAKQASDANLAVINQPQPQYQYNPGAAATATPAPAPPVMAPAPVISAPVQSNAPGSAVASIPVQLSYANTGIVTQPTVVQSNAPAASVVIPGVATASNWSGLLTQSTILASTGIPDSVLVLGGLAVAWMLFSGKR